LKGGALNIKQIILPVIYNVVASKIEGHYLSDHFPVYAKFRWLDKT